MPTNGDYLVAASLMDDRVRCFQCRRDELLTKLAEGHAEYMAKTGVQGHQNFQARYDQIRKELGLRATEICAESWSWETTVEDAARSMFDSWQRSDGHWKVCAGEWDCYGAAMAKGRRVWYGCVIVAKE